MTTRLYWEDSHLTRFEATVVDSVVRSGQVGLILDQTAFYPTGGGQPSDTGSIGPYQVSAVERDEQERILHWVEGSVPARVGEKHECLIDWDRRREMIQQHTAQHILSQSFFQLFGAETVGFRILDRSTEIDLALDEPPERIPELVHRAEDLTNSIIFENRPIRLHQLNPSEASRLPLRKESFVTDCVRVVEIADFDWSPCGGTHAAATGEVGLVVIRTTERAKRMLRVHFLAGARALADYRISNSICDTLARRLTVGREELDASIDRIQAESKNLLRRNRELGNIAAKVEADQLCTATPYSSEGFRAVINVFQQRELDDLKVLAHHLADNPKTVALLALREEETVRLVFARSSDLEIDVGQLMKNVTSRLGGRGGGRPDFAQGGVEGSEQILSILTSLLS